MSEEGRWRKEEEEERKEGGRGVESGSWLRLTPWAQKIQLRGERQMLTHIGIRGAAVPQHTWRTAGSAGDGID